MSMWLATCTTRVNHPASIDALPSFELVSGHEDAKQGQTPVRWHR
jgi:hypothetical protein